MKRSIAVGLLVLVGTGCYTLQPVAGQPLPLGSIIGLEITDAGRVALGGSMGPEIGLVEGRLVQRDAAEYVVAVSGVRFLRGGEQKWTGERVRIKTEHVSTVSEKKFSRGRTAVIGAIALGGVAAFVTQAILGSGQGDVVKTPGDTTAESIRIPWPLHRP